MPPIQTLQPSPKLMGRSSPDEPIPAPVKNMVAAPVEPGVNLNGSGSGIGLLGQNKPSDNSGDVRKDTEEL